MVFVYLRVGSRGGPLMPYEVPEGSVFFRDPVSVWAGLGACLLTMGLLSACLAVLDPRGIPKR
jgi:hypothetical protein